MAIIRNDHDRAIFSSLGRIEPGHSDNVPDNEVEPLEAKYRITVLQRPEAKKPQPPQNPKPARPVAKKKAAARKKGPATKRYKPQARPRVDSALGPDEPGVDTEEIYG